jgi:hypothetical protein
MKKDDSFGRRGEVRKSGEPTGAGIPIRLSIGKHYWLEQRSQSGDPDAAARKPEELASR